MSHPLQITELTIIEIDLPQILNPHPAWSIWFWFFRYHWIFF